jgi:hypothetical protein
MELGLQRDHMLGQHRGRAIGYGNECGMDAGDRDRSPGDPQRCALVMT